MAEEFERDFAPGESETGGFQKFQMVDKPYKGFIERKASMGQRDFSFIPPKKQTEQEENPVFTEREEPCAAVQGEKSASFSESLPNPYGAAGWRSFGSAEENSAVPPVQPRVSDYSGYPPRKPRRKGNVGLLIFLLTAAVLFCSAAVWYISIAFSPEASDGQDSVYEENAAEPEISGEYLRSDVEIVLVPQSADRDSTAEEAYKKIMPSTVLIITSPEGLENSSGEVFQGTGVIIHSDGYIVTNSHVIENRGTGVILVADNLGRMYEADVVGFDRETDIAVIKIDGTDLVPAEFAQTEDIKVGQEVVALGNPEGIYFRNSFTKGIISALNRRFDSEVSYIQVDAAINPGNSGGPLCNMDGQIIGINTSKLAKENFEGIAFAIPSDTVRDTVNDLIKYGEVREKLSLGIYGYRITQEDGEAENIPAGVLIAEIIPDSPAENSGLRAGDVIISLDGALVDSVEDIKSILYYKFPGDAAEAEYMRCNSDGQWEQGSCEIELFYY